MNSGIYAIKNLINDKMYIGSSVDVDIRYKSHISALRNTNHPNRYLQAAFNKHGEKAFDFELLEKCEHEFLLTKEKEYILAKNTLNRKYGYNLAPEPYGGSRGIVWSQKSKNKLSNTLKKQYKNKERVAASFKHSNSAKLKISKAGRGRIASNRRPIWCNQTEICYLSLHHAAAALNISLSGIADVLAKRKKLVCGYTFEYVEKSFFEVKPKQLRFSKLQCIDTGQVYENMSVLAKKMNVSPSTISKAISKKYKIKGLTFIRVIANAK